MRSGQDVNTHVLFFIQVHVFFCCSCSCLCIEDNRWLWHLGRVLAGFVLFFSPKALRDPEPVCTWITCGTAQMFHGLSVLIFLGRRKESCSRRLTF